MIFVKRPPLRGALADRLRYETLTVLRNYDRLNRQTRIELPAVWRHAFKPLEELFAGKCAYCESKYDAAAIRQVDHYRPMQHAMGFDRRTDPDHYFWLAYDWDNLLPSCTFCMGAKESQFPILAPKRAPVGSFRAQLDIERALLLDPCKDRHPERHLEFQDDGFVVSLTERGEATIRVLDLNREPLVSTRAKQIGLARDAFTRNSQKLLDDLTAPSARYAGAVRNCLTRWERGRPARRRIIAALPDSVRPGKLRKIRVRNFRTLRNVTVTLPQHPDGAASCLMLLGENGTGKSSLLQAVSLALVGTEGIREIGQETLDDSITNGKNSARITLTFEEPASVIDLTLRRGGAPRFTRGSEGYNSVVVAYGAVRLTARDATLPIIPDDLAARRVLNLFDPWVGLADPDLWLTKLRKDEFDYAARTLKDLLHRSTERRAIFHQRKSGIVADVGCDRVSLRQLSSGYRSIVALGTDLMSAIPRSILDKQAATGIVLIDELDAHLHPRWKREVVKILRKCFPRIQFLASTHEPLCLVGMREKETLLMHRNEKTGAVEVDPNLPSPEGLRVDQILTSRHFGLHTTIDPVLDAKFRNYYRLLSIRETDLTMKQAKELAALKTELGNVGILGYTRRDQLVYELIDKFIVEESRIPARERRPLAKKLQNEVLDIWRHVKTVSQEES